MAGMRLIIRPLCIQRKLKVTRTYPAEAGLHEQS
jgi:hypothetical protein